MESVAKIPELRAGHDIFGGMSKMYSGLQKKQEHVGLKVNSHLALVFRFWGGRRAING